MAFYGAQRAAQNAAPAFSYTLNLLNATRSPSTISERKKTDILKQQRLKRRRFELSQSPVTSRGSRSQMHCEILNFLGLVGLVF